MKTSTKTTATNTATARSSANEVGQMPGWDTRCHHRTSTIATKRPLGKRSARAVKPSPKVCHKVESRLITSDKDSKHQLSH